MQEEPRCALQAANPIIKLVRERQDLFFELLNFVTHHLQSSSNDLDALTVFNKFILVATAAHHDQVLREQQFLTTFWDVSQVAAPKQMMRLTSRLMQILQGSLGRVRKSILEQSGRAVKQFSRFKLIINKMMKKETFGLKAYVQHVLSYCSGRYIRQLAKVQKYVDRVGQGEDLWFKDIYHKQNSDIESSPDEKKQITLEKTLKKMDHKVEHHEQPDKKMSLKKTVKNTIKRKECLSNLKKKPSEEQLPNKQPAGKKLLKFYSMLELNKKQFLQDYAYDKSQQQKHKTGLLDRLLERNKEINKQINGFIKKSNSCVPLAIAVSNNHSSGDERNQSIASKMSLRTSFVISKRKPSFHLQNYSNNQKVSQGQKIYPVQKTDPLESTIKNVNPRRRSSHSNQRFHPQQKSKKLFVVKQPMMFQDEVIPQVQITQTQWLGAQLTVKGREHKNQNIRLKRKNNPSPMQNAFLPQTFRYPV